MNSSQLRNMSLGSGAGIRGPDCHICTIEMESSEPTVTHDLCKNTFHKECLDGWADQNCEEFEIATCPMCRERLGDPFEMKCTVASADMKTTEDEMWDYDMRPRENNNLMTLSPALVHRWRNDQKRAEVWLLEYFVRVHRARVLTSEEAVEKIARYRICLDWPNVVSPVPDHLQPGEFVTDFEIIGLEGRRRPRDGIVDVYEVWPNVAKSKIRTRMNANQQYIGLPLHDMNAFITRYERRVKTIVRRRVREMLGER